MADYRDDLQFGIFVTQAADQAPTVLGLARLADVVGLGLVPVRKPRLAGRRCQSDSSRARR